MPVLHGASGFVVHGDLIDNSRSYHTASGLDTLLKASYPDAAHDSAARDPPKCFPGTRLQHIEDITGWARLLAAERCFRLMWLQGPAGVGKSALAQTCAEKLQTEGRLAAAFFFSRPNDRQDSTCLFTSIAYQLTTKYPAYREKLDEKIRRDPTLVNKNIAVQFQELIVAPIQELQKEGSTLGEGIIFIDGLDECAGEESQCNIIDIISSSVRNQSTSFIWAFFSRPEPRIVARFDASHVHDLCWRLTLPVSRDADGEIELYLWDAFERIRKQYDIPSAVLWPSKGNMRDLVDRSAGLFIYPSSVVRFVGEGGPLGPEEQLQLVLRLPSKSSGNPFSYLDAFYTLIMKQSSTLMLPNTLKILAFYTCARQAHPAVAAALLGFSLSTFSAALSKLHSVIKLTRSASGLPTGVSFYHASFTDFLEDMARSGEFCAKTPELYASLLAEVIELGKKGFKNVTAPWSAEDFHFPREMFYIFWSLGSYAKLDEALLVELSQFDFRELNFDTRAPGPDSDPGHAFPKRPDGEHRAIPISYVRDLCENIPPAQRGNIIRHLNQEANCEEMASMSIKREKFPYVLGNGRNRIVLFILAGARPPVACTNYMRYMIWREGDKTSWPAHIRLLRSLLEAPGATSMQSLLQQLEEDETIGPTGERTLWRQLEEDGTFGSTGVKALRRLLEEDGIYGSTGVWTLRRLLEEDETETSGPTGMRLLRRLLEEDETPGLTGMRLLRQLLEETSRTISARWQFDEGEDSGLTRMMLLRQALEEAPGSRGATRQLGEGETSGPTSPFRSHMPSAKGPSVLLRSSARVSRFLRRLFHRVKRGVVKFGAKF